MKRSISFLLALVMMFSLGACQNGTKNDDTGSTTKNPNAVYDMANREITIPEDGATVASVYAVAAPFFVLLQVTDRVVAVNVKSNFLKEADENLANAGTVGRGQIDMEALATYNPGIFLHRVTEPEGAQAVADLGIEVVCIQNESTEDFLTCLDLLGKVFHKEDRALEVAEWFNNELSEIEKITSQIPENERKTALVLGGEVGRIAGGDMLQTDLIEKAGGIPVAKGTKNNKTWMNIGVEKIFEWNPEFLFCTSSTVLEYKIDELKTDKAWSDVTAIKNGDIAVIPAKIDSWDMPGIANVLAIYWMINQMYPEYFSTEQLHKEVDDYYTFVYGKTFDYDYIGYYD